MNHKVTNVTKLHEDAFALYEQAVRGNADSILDNLYMGVENLKANWKGKDAGLQIQNVVLVYNAMVALRNALAEFAVDSSKVAANYREIQNSNGAGLETLSVLSFEAKTTMADYSDMNDTININAEVNTGKAKVEAARDAIEGFMSKAEAYYNEIRQNWQSGTGVESAQDAFETFKSSVTNYKTILSDVSANISTALANYTM